MRTEAHAEFDRVILQLQEKKKPLLRLQPMQQRMHKLRRSRHLLKTDPRLMPHKPLLSPHTARDALIKQSDRDIDKIRPVGLPPKHNGAAAGAAFAEFAWAGHVLYYAWESAGAWLGVDEGDGEVCVGMEDVAAWDERPGLELCAGCEAAGGAGAVACEETGGCGRFVGGGRFEPPFLVGWVTDFGEVGDVVWVEEVGEGSG